jgi:hypothetical protein
MITAMRITVWVVFIALCIQTGAIMYSFFVSLFINTQAAKNLYLGLNLADLYSFGIWRYVLMVILIICLSALKAYIAYLVTRIFLKINFAHPFSLNIALLIKRISYMSFVVGILALTANAYSEMYIISGLTPYTLPQYAALNNVLAGGSEFLFFGGIIFIIALVFNRGIEMQAENELTV